MVKRGMAPYGPPGYQTDMAGFADILSDAEIWAVLAYIKSKWPPEFRTYQERITEGGVGAIRASHHGIEVSAQLPYFIRMAQAKLSILIASAVAATLANAAWADSDAGASTQIDEKCYGVAQKDVTGCGADPQTCADSATLQTNKPGEEEWAYVPKGTCVKIYGGSLTPKQPKPS